MKIKTSDLSDIALDWAVTKCEKPEISLDHFMAMHGHYAYDSGTYLYSTNWAQGGPIIERWEIGIKRRAPCMKGEEWEASPSITAKGAGGKFGCGPTPLIAAMRCYVASKLGDEVEIPKKLLVS